MNRILCSITLALALALAPAASEAAWWPWSKRDKDKETPAEAPTPEMGDRFERIEAQMRMLTGQVEELTFQVRQLQEQLLRAQGTAPAKPKAALEAPAGGVLVVPESGGAAPAPVARLAAPAPPPAEGLGRVADAEGPIDLTAASRGTSEPAAVAVMPEPAPAPAPAPAVRTITVQPKSNVFAALGDPRQAYQQAYDSILSGNYERAEAGFRVFLASHPDDDRASDAQYWLGESLFARGKYREAAVEFLNGHNAFPAGAKAPDALLKLGLSLAGLGQQDAACQTYAKVLKDYPKASKALRQRVTVEQGSAGC